MLRIQREEDKPPPSQEELSVAKLIMRFPRLYLTPKMVIAEKILRHTYNTMSEARSTRKGNGFRWYDIYKTKQGKTAPVKFLMLAQDLVNKKIDPAVYVKVLSQYGMYQNARFLPHPSWMASEKAQKKFKWLLKRTKRKYHVKGDWQKALKHNRVDEIRQGMKISALMVRDVRRNFSLKLYEALLLLRSELSPWYWATFLSLIKRKKRRDEVLDFLMYEERDLHKAVILCTKFFLDNKPVWRRACNILRKYL